MIFRRFEVRSDVPPSPISKTTQPSSRHWFRRKAEEEAAWLNRFVSELPQGEAQHWPKYRVWRRV